MFNNPVVAYANCSFENADTVSGAYGRDQLSGGKAYDRGDGRVAQRVTFGGGCTTVQWLVFTECATGEAIAIQGESNASADGVEIAGLTSQLVSNIQPPNGPIRADRSDTVKKLAAQAEANELSYEIKSESDNEPNGYGLSFGLWKNYPTNCGCKKFYPGSAGAKN